MLHRPKLIRLNYLGYDAASHICSRRLLLELTSIYQKASMTMDFYHLNLQAELGTSCRLMEVLLTGAKFCAYQLKKFFAKAQHIYEGLGQWAADYFITESTKNFKKTVDIEKGIFARWESNEKAYLLRLLSEIPIAYLTSGETPWISPKLD
jgi:hypothetical protein